MRLYFVRHGESEANILREVSNRGLKHGLTDKGRQQSLMLAQKFRGIPIAKVFSSPLLRAIQTAEILVKELGISYEITDALREYDCGILEGKSDSVTWEIFDSVFRDWLQNGNWERRIDQGESFLDIKERFVPFIENLIEEYQHSSEDIVLVSHGGTYRCMLPLVLTNVDFPFALEHGFDNARYVSAEMKQEKLACLSWCGEVMPPAL
ncbi:histidine phosphatase family protein [Candidatus Poribacteria bacterium]